MKGGIFILNHDIFEIINRIDRLTQGYTSNLTRVIDQLNRINEAYSPVASALATAMEKNFLALSKVSDALLPVAKEWEAVTDFIREQDYSHLFISDSLSSKLMELIESVETEVPDIKEEIQHTTGITVSSPAQVKKLTIADMAAIIALIISVITFYQAQYNAEQSSIQSERQHRELMEQSEKHNQSLLEQADRHHRERMKQDEEQHQDSIANQDEKSKLINSLITELHSSLTSEDTTHHVNQ
ncbi:hypothetical protein M5X02_04865 [Paenibacillus alvei]|uniref:hypothetical protein n=1 Tax=Paenibacillus alvei TaxID=44250 RepID=UPI002283F61D|nr:hypothetical protein [Paenibacillus alvei]MCY9540014.1 hypothetical protein [Paenibacillus alvei]